MIVLDTHALVWWANRCVCISAWEIAMLVEREKLVLSMDLESRLTTVSAIDAIRFMPVDVEIGLKSVDLPGEFHRDRADRMIVATARKLAAPLVTRDEKNRAYKHVKTIW